MGVSNIDISSNGNGFWDGFVTTIKNGVMWGGRQVAKITSKLSDVIQSIWLKAKPYIKETACMLWGCLKWGCRQIAKLVAKLGKQIQAIWYSLKLYIKEMPRIIYEALKWSYRKITKFASKLGELTHTVWLSAKPYIKETAIFIFEFLKDNPVITAVGSTLAACGFFYASSRTKFKPLDIALKVLGCAALILVGVSIKQTMA